MIRSSNSARRFAMLLAVSAASIYITPISIAEDAQSIDGWGRVIDPDGDCGIDVTDGVLTVQVPDTLHDLNQRNGALNAPRIVQEVSGDFRLEVTVSGKFQPGPEATSPKSTAFNGAGILLWHNAKSHIRLERNSFGEGYCFPPLFELRHEGKYLGANPPVAPDSYFSGDRTSLKIERHGKVFIAYIQLGDKEWQLVKSRRVDLPDKLLVGVSAINTSNAAMTVKFSGLKLTKLN